MVPVGKQKTHKYRFVINSKCAVDMRKALAITKFSVSLFDDNEIMIIT